MQTFNRLVSIAVVCLFVLAHGPLQLAWAAGSPCPAVATMTVATKSVSTEHRCCKSQNDTKADTEIIDAIAADSSPASHSGCDDCQDCSCCPSLVHSVTMVAMGHPSILFVNPPSTTTIHYSSSHPLGWLPLPDQPPRQA